MNNCKIIAEIGWNHGGDMLLARKMISSAKECGADYVKFQTWSTKYLKEGSWDLDGRRELYKNAELSHENHLELKKHCDDIGIEFLSSIFNVKHISLLKDIGCEEVKIASTEILNFDLVGECLKNFNHVYISTGGLTSDELDRALHFLKPHNNKVTLLHCVSLYPCSMGDCNIERIEILKKLYSGNVGYSDHTSETWAPYMAISKGASVVEKHFTIDNNLPGRDNLYACLPEGLKKICSFRDAHEKCLRDVSIGRNEKEDSIVEFRGRWS